MTRLRGFSDNPFQTRLDLIRAAVALVKPLEQYKSPGNARIRISTDSGAGFDEVAAQLEGFSRPLWVVANLMHILQTEQDDNILSLTSELNLDSWKLGLVAGTDPTSNEYWGDLGNFDQRMVEMESISYALLTVPDAFDVVLNEEARDNLMGWLGHINSRTMPQSNWLWFRIFVNIVLCATSTKDQFIEKDLETLDTFYLGEGWSSDGLWSEERKQADYYSGSFAIQYAQLLFVNIVEKHEDSKKYEARIKKYKDEARLFASSFWRYFDVHGERLSRSLREDFHALTNDIGAAIPFGRSLTYRFAFVAFWSAVVAAGVELAPPLDKLGVVKGFLLRHLRWWAQHTGIFNPDGTLNIGYTYPNMYMSEDYNSPQSVYWCLKTFIIIGLPGDHPFWTCDELPHPLDRSVQKTIAGWRDSPVLSEVAAVWPPKHILCNRREHHFLLSSGQSTNKHHKAREAKYGKFAYSSAFGFSVPTGPLLEQLAPDSTLCVSLDDGDTWSVRCKPFNVCLDKLKVTGRDMPAEEVSVLRSTWRPHRTANIHIETTLVPPVTHQFGWHLRIHRVTWESLSKENEVIRLIDSGFALQGQARNGLAIPQIKHQDRDHRNAFEKEGWFTGEDICLVMCDRGASGVADLTYVSQHQETQQPSYNLKSRPMLLRPDANTNIMSQRTLIPAIAYSIMEAKIDGIAPESMSKHDTHRQTWLVTAVFGIAFSPGIEIHQIREAWSRGPEIRVILDSHISPTGFELVRTGK